MTASPSRRFFIATLLFLTLLPSLLPALPAEARLQDDAADVGAYDLRQVQKRQRAIQELTIALGAGDNSPFGQSAKDKIFAFVRQLDEDNYFAMGPTEKAIYWRQHKYQGFIQQLAKFELGGLTYLPPSNAATYVMDLATYAIVGKGAEDFNTQQEAGRRFWKTFFDQAGGCLSGGIDYKTSYPYPSQFANVFLTPDSKRTFIDSCPDLHDLLYQLGFPKDIEAIFGMPPTFKQENKFRVKWTPEEINAFKSGIRFAYPPPSDPSIQKLKDAIQTQAFGLNMILGFFFMKIDGDPKTGQVAFGPDPVGAVIGLATMGLLHFGGGAAGDALGNWVTKNTVRQTLRTEGNVSSLIGGQFEKEILAAQQQVLAEGGVVVRTPKFGKGSGVSYARQGELTSLNTGLFQSTRLAFVESEWERMFVRGEYVGPQTFAGSARVFRPTAQNYQNVTNALVAFLAGQRDGKVFSDLLTRENGSPITKEMYDWLLQHFGNAPSRDKVVEPFLKLVQNSESFNQRAQNTTAFYDLLTSFREQPSPAILDDVGRIKAANGGDAAYQAQYAALGNKTVLEYADGFMPWLLRRAPELHRYELEVHINSFGTERQLKLGQDLKMTNDLDVAIDYNAALTATGIENVDSHPPQAFLDSLNQANQSGQPLTPEKKIQEYLSYQWEQYLRSSDADGAGKLGQTAGIPELYASGHRGINLVFDDQFSIEEAVAFVKKYPDKSQWRTVAVQTGDMPGLLWAFGADEDTSFSFTISQALFDRYGRIPKKIVDNIPWMAKAIERARADLATGTLRATFGIDGKMPTVKDLSFPASAYVRDGYATNIYLTGRALRMVFRGFKELENGVRYDPTTEKLIADLWTKWFRDPNVSNDLKAQYLSSATYQEGQTFFKGQLERYYIPAVKPRLQGTVLTGFDIFPKRWVKLLNETSPAAQAQFKQITDTYRIVLQFRPDPANNSDKYVLMDFSLPELFNLATMDGSVVPNKASFIRGTGFDLLPTDGTLNGGTIRHYVTDEILYYLGTYKQQNGRMPDMTPAFRDLLRSRFNIDVDSVHDGRLYWTIH